MKEKAIAFIELLELLHNGYRVEVRVNLCGGLCSRHELSLEDDDSILDFSYVDSEETRYTPTEFYRSIVAKASEHIRGKRQLLTRLNFVVEKQIEGSKDIRFAA